MVCDVCRDGGGGGGGGGGGVKIRASDPNHPAISVRTPTERRANEKHDDTQRPARAAAQ